jgi:hypothetical protein
MVSEVVVDGVGGIAAGDALAVEEDVLFERRGSETACAICFIEGAAAHSVPVELVRLRGRCRRSFGNTLAIAILGVRQPTGGDQVVFCVVFAGRSKAASRASGVENEMACGIVAVAHELVFGVCSSRLPALLQTANVSRLRSDVRTEGGKIVPGIVVFSSRSM